MRTMNILAFFWLTAWAGWALLLIVLSLTPDPPEIPLPFLSWDKFQHVAAYTVLMILTLHSWKTLWPGSPAVCWWAAAGSLALGAILELLQEGMAIGRSADFNDMLANSLGVIGGGLLYLCWLRVYRRRN